MPSGYIDFENNRAVVAALKRDGEVAFDAVYRHYYRGLCVFCSQYVGELEEAEEIVQDTMLWLWENRSTLMEELNFKTLMFTIVKNKALNRLWHVEVKRKVLQEIVEKYETEFENPDIYLTEELLRLYKDAVNKLPPEFKEAYELTRNQQLTHREIAERLNVSPQTVNYRIGQALKYLRIALKDYLPLVLFYIHFGAK